MAKQYVDMATLKYLLYQVNNLEEVHQRERYSDHDKESTEIFLESVKDFSDKELYPYFKEVDEQAAHFKDGKIIVHPQVEVVMKKSAEMGLINGIFEYEHGGLQMPYMSYTAAIFIQEAANNHLTGYTGLTLGAAELILEFGNEELKEKYVPKMTEGEWGGTMCLTEPQAGSSLSDITTSATPSDDGSYQIKGQKIFISGGDHEYASNFVHLVLARIEGAPRGTKGISLFVVPKHRIEEDGSLAPNDVLTGGDFQKLGQRGYCTTHLVFGEHDNCKGWLVGEAHHGLKYMFLMMNGARIAVGRGGAAIATAAYLASLEYAQERPQGRRINNAGQKNVDEEQTLIINHPDVRRMLMLQKAISEGSLALVLRSARYADMMLSATDEKEKEKFKMLMEIMTPMVKTYPAEMGAESVDNGVQVLGGYGFCTEYILQQYLRDIRIFSLYEGTTGIQSLDLLGRKIPMKGGQAVQLLAAEVMETIQAAMTFEDLKPYATKLGDNLQLTQKVLGFLSGFAMKGEYERYISDATLFMEFFSKIVLGWLWLDMATHSKKALVTGDKTYSEAFHESKIHTMKFYYKYELARTTSIADILMDETVLTIPTEKEIFA